MEEPSKTAVNLGELASAKGLLNDSALARAVSEASADKWVNVLERAYADAANGDASARDFLLAAEVMCW